jgi:hypothetical protein
MRILILGVVLLLSSVTTRAQRICCTFLDIIAPSCSYQIIQDASPAGYYVFRGEAGCTYEFSHCNGGGTFTGDPYLTVANEDCGEIAWNDDFCGLGSQLTWTCAETGMYQLHMGTFSAGCTALTRTLAYRITNAPPAIAIANVPPICAGNAYQLQATTSADEVYWSPAIGLSCANCPNPIASPNQTTTYTATVNSGCCTASATVTVIVKPTFNISVNQDICEGQSFPFAGQTLTLPGQYTHTFFSASGCDSTVVLNLGYEIATADVNVFGGVITTNQPGASYQWFDCETNLPIPGANSQFFVPELSGDYGVVVTTSAGCTATSDCSNVTSVSEAGKPSPWVVFPNPAIDYVMILNAPNRTFDILDNTGRQVSTFRTSSEGQFRADLSALSAGIYFIRDTSSGKTERIVIHR